MAFAERSWWVVACAVAVVALLGASIQFPWFTYKTTSASHSPPGGPTGAGDASVERSRLSFYPFETQGNASASRNQSVVQATQTMGRLVVAAGVSAALVPLLDLAFGWWRPIRFFSLLLAAASVLAAGGALAYAWFEVPPTLTGEGVNDVFTSRRIGELYVQTYLDAGWIIAGAGFVLGFALLGFRYAVGAADATAIEDYRSKKKTA